MHFSRRIFFAILGVAIQAGTRAFGADDASVRWLAGDHHVHSEYSVGWNHKGDISDDAPPTPRIRGDAVYPIERNAQKAREYGLDWMVSTDHGGPRHSKVNAEWAYPDVLAARDSVPEIILFYGMEFDTPGADHASLIMPYTDDEKDLLYSIESRYNKREPYPMGADADTEARMNKAVAFMKEIPVPPVLIVNHPARSFKNGTYGKVSPEELRRWNDIAPEVVVGMEGAPGHQARAVNPDGSLVRGAPRGGYETVQTRGGFDPLTAIVGGFWDSMLGEGRRWWITATSDSHRNWRHGGDEFWPGEYAKTYVYAEKTHDSILEAIRQGRIFVTTGDLINELSVEVSEAGCSKKAGIGGALSVHAGADLIVDIGFKEPDIPNAHGDRPKVDHVDVIVGNVLSETAPDADVNQTAMVHRRIEREDFVEEDGAFKIRLPLPAVSESFYLRVRGSNGDEDEPLPDPPGEDPWKDLWFYSNPVFVEIAQ